MYKNNIIISCITAVVACVLLFLWFYFGFNAIDNPVDLVLWIFVLLVILICAYILHRDKKNWVSLCRKIIVYDDDTFQIGGMGNQYFTTGLRSVDTVVENFELMKKRNYQTGLPHNFVSNIKHKTPKYVIDTKKYNTRVWSGTIYDINRDSVSYFSRDIPDDLYRVLV